MFIRICQTDFKESAYLTHALLNPSPALLHVIFTRSLWGRYDRDRAKTMGSPGKQLGGQPHPIAYQLWAASQLRVFTKSSLPHLNEYKGNINDSYLSQSVVFCQSLYEALDFSTTALDLGFKSCLT